MRILLVGANGTIGRAVAAELASRHEIVAAGRSSGDLRVDLTDAATIDAAFSRGPFDAVISAAGNVAFGPLVELTAEQWDLGLRDKLMGQVGLAQAAVRHLRSGGSITLTSGILSEDPVRHSAAAAMVNAGLEGFVRAAALEMPRGLRINVVSPTVLAESMAGFGSFFRGFEPAPAARVALAYARSAEGADNGRIFRVQ